MRDIIIDPTSTELNRGSFCYQPYLLYSYLKNGSYPNEVAIWEDFTIPQMDWIEPDDEVLVSLWSYPQIDLCKVLYRFCPSRNIKFFGYTPLIKELGLPCEELSEVILTGGMRYYPQELAKGSFKTVLLSDCDMHMKKYDGLVYPMFTSYGCPRNCSFCPSSVNCNHKVTELQSFYVKDAFRVFKKNGIKNIHFTDEDFFLDPLRAYYILNDAVKIGDFNFIALAHLGSLERFVDKFGPECLKDLGVRVIELGFETADPSLAKNMHKKHSLERYVNLYERVKRYTDIFWLCLTFFPGETISTLNATGEFLSKYGSKPEDLYSRIVTNSTEGGLGQFFQPYPGTPGYEKLSSLGMQIEDRPIRLLPSFLPDSFLDDEISINHFPESLSELTFWRDIYNLPIDKVQFSALGGEVRKAIAELMNKHNCDVGQAATFLAILARLRIIRSANDENN